MAAVSDCAFIFLSVFSLLLSGGWAKFSIWINTGGIIFTWGCVEREETVKLDYFSFWRASIDCSSLLLEGKNVAVQFAGCSMPQFNLPLPIALNWVSLIHAPYTCSKCIHIMIGGYIFQLMCTSYSVGIIMLHSTSNHRYYTFWDTGIVSMCKHSCSV